MMPWRRRFLSYLLLIAAAVPSLVADPDMTLLPANDSRYLLEGRLDRANPAQPVVIWAGSRISLDFGGSALAVVFGEATGQNFFNLTVDGVTEIIGVPAGPGQRIVWPHALGEGRHTLQLFKRSEADAGHAAFRGVELAAGAQAWAPTPPAYRFRMEFIGDSMTVGACNEDPAADQWDDRRTHNHALSYGFLTSQALGADHRALAVSGMGIAEGYVPMKAGETWDKLYPRDHLARADLQAWLPHVVCVNFGENDVSFPLNNGRPFPAGYTSGYVSLIKAIRTAYPSAQIVMLRGGMHGSANNPDLRTAWEAAVREVESADSRVSHFVFTHWSQVYPHPRVSDDRAMAAELTAWLQAQPWLQAILAKSQAGG
jgi:lysophospholipase L1-like esterase